ncbi:MAG: hypothetical protein HY897_18690 [Deltaproteobacteria bacterium]|nr:hypothetical protein [Deltaproteobacteria bacterium]
MRRSLLVVGSLALCLWATPSFAGEGFFRLLAVEGGTDFPVSIGVRGTAQFPYGIELRAGAGFMPGGYVKLINSTLVSAGAYNQETADLITDSLSNSLILSIDAGWDPGDPGGFFVDAGYLMAALGGKVSTTTLISQATGKDLSWVQGNPGIPVSTTLHNLTLTAGWRFVFVEHLQLTVALGVLKTIASSTTAEFKTGENIPGLLGREIQSKVAQAQEDIDTYMNDIYVKYVVSPFVTVNAGYRF